MHAGWAGRGEYYPPSTLLARRAHNQRSGPRKPCKGWSGWVMRPGAPAGPWYHPAGPVGHPGALPVPGPSSPGNAASWPIKARLRSKHGKVSQNSIVSPKYVEKACLSPCFQNGLEKSPLEISRFPFSVAFSHKELIGPFDRGADFMFKMTKCRQMYTRMSHARWSSDTPRHHAASCLCDVLLI